jgi:hypothetical membrane protein
MGSSRSEYRGRVAAISGLLAVVVMTTGWIVAGLIQPASYSWSAQEISDLGALTARHPWVWNVADSLAGLLLVVFAAGVFPLLRADRSARIAVLLIGLVGVGSVFDGLLREDCPLSTSEACQRLQDGPGLSWHHQAHNIESVIVFTAMLLGPFVLARAFRRVDRMSGIRIYSLATGIAMVLFAAVYLLLYGEDGGGIAQRVLVVLYLAWIAVLAVHVLSAREPMSLDGIADSSSTDPGLRREVEQSEV